MKNKYAFSSARQGWSPPLGDLVSPLHTHPWFYSKTFPHASHPLIPLLSPSSTVMRPQRWGVQDGRRDSRGAPLNCRIWVGRGAPRTSRRRTGVFRDRGVKRIKAHPVRWGRREAPLTLGVGRTRGRGYDPVTHPSTSSWRVRGTQAAVPPPSPLDRAAPAQVGRACEGHGVGQQARRRREGCGPEVL